jgi:pimeloyl-ACP methyl ester carboxylesterase
MECARFGRGGKPMVIMPGLSMKSLMPFAQAVAERYRIFADDFQIHLLEQPLEPPTGCRADFLAKAAAEAFDALGIRGACVVGISAGGMTAQLLAAARPDLAARLFLGSTCAKVTQEAAARLEGWAVLAEERQTAELIQTFAADIYTPRFYGQCKDAILSSYGGATEAELSHFSVLARAFLEFDATEALGKIQCPVLAVGAAQDRIFGAEAAPLIAQLSGGSAESYVYQGYGHAVYDEAADYPERIRAFFG